MSEYAFLYRGGENGRSPERAQQMMQKWIVQDMLRADGENQFHYGGRKSRTLHSDC